LIKKNAYLQADNKRFLDAFIALGTQ